MDKWYDNPYDLDENDAVYPDSLIDDNYAQGQRPDDVITMKL